MKRLPISAYFSDSSHRQRDTMSDFIDNCIVDWPQITEELNTACTPGFRCIALVMPDGITIASSKPPEDIDVTSVGTIIRNLYKNFQFFVTKPQQLSYVHLDCDNGQIAALPLGHLMLCVIADKSVQPGMLSLKVSIEFH